MKKSENHEKERRTEIKRKWNQKKTEKKSNKNAKKRRERQFNN